MDPVPAAPPPQPKRKFVFFVDGFNLYHALHGPNTKPAFQYRKYKWLDLSKLCSLFVPPNTGILSKVYYFTSLAHWDAGKVNRHKTYLRALESTGISAVMGKFKWKTRYCHLCKGQYPTWEEKQTDVNIALEIMQSAIRDEFETAVIVSGDSDLLPAVRAVRKTFPGKHLGVLIPPGRSAEELKAAADFHQKMKEHHLSSCQFPDPLQIAPGVTLAKPPTWG